MAIFNYADFESGSSTVELLSGTSSIQSSVVKDGTYSLLVNPSGTGTGYAYLPIAYAADGTQSGLASHTVLAFSFYFRYSTKPTSASEEIFGTYYSLGFSAACIRIDSNGNLLMYNGATLLETGTTALSANTWYRISGVFDSVADTYSVNIDGASELSGTNTGGIGIAASIGKTINKNGNSVSFYYDNIILTDGEEPDELWKIAMLVPDADGSTMQWNNGGSDYTDINEIPASTTNYIETNGSADQTALFSFPNCDDTDIGDKEIKSVSGIMWASEPSAVTSANDIRMKSGSTTVSTTDVNLTNNSASNLSVRTLVKNTDPDTSAAWTKSGLDALEFGANEANTVTVRGYFAELKVLYVDRIFSGASITGGANLNAGALARLSAETELIGDSSLTIDSVILGLMGSSSLSGDSSLNIGNVVVNTAILEVDKYYSYKVYDLNGDFVGQWNDVDSEFTYSQEINSAGSSVDVILARNSDTKEPTLGDLLDNTEAIIETQDNTPINTTEGITSSIGPGSNVVLNYDVDVYIYYGQYGDLATEDNNNLATEDDNQIQAQQGSPDGSIIFQGYISKYISRYGGNEKTTVTLTSYGAELDNYIIESGGFTQVDWLSKDPSTILKDVIDLYQAQGGIVDYDNTTVDNTNTVVTYTFNTATTLDGIKKSLELAPSDWFWYLDMRNNLINFHNRPTTPDHTFVLGKHIKELDVEQYIDDITNVVYFSGGDTGGGNNLFLKYTDPTSETNYRRGLKLYSDNRVTLSSSADIIANSELERNSAPRYRSSVVIVDKVYDIESIQLGDLVAFRNFDNYVDDLEMQVVGIDYSPDAIRLQLDTLLPRVSKRLEDIKRNLDKQETLANPTAPS